MTTKLLAITNCLDCPHHKVMQDPSSDDSWDFHDESAFCTKAPKHASRKTRWNPEGLRHIAGPDRSVRRKECSIPDWCPLGSITEHKKS